MDTVRFAQLSLAIIACFLTLFRLTAAVIGTDCPYSLVTRPADEVILPMTVSGSSSGSVTFHVRGSQKAFIYLYNGNTLLYRIGLHTGTPASLTCDIQNLLSGYTGAAYQASRVTGPVLSSTEFRPFWISWTNTNLSVGNGTAVGSSVLVSATRPPAGFLTGHPDAFNKISAVSTTDTLYWNFGQQSGHHGMFLDPEVDGTMTSPNYGAGTYPANKDCQWVVHTDLSMKFRVIQFIFRDVKLQGKNFANTCVDKVTIRGNVSDAPGLAECGSALPAVYEVTSATAHVAFTSDTFTQAGGFSLEFKIIQCKEGNYGSNCSKICSCVTANTASCDRVSGKCYCQEGWEGDTCSVAVLSTTSSSSSSPSSSPSSSSPPPSLKTFICRNPFDTMAHPSNCTLFVQCSWGRPIVMQCPPTTYFNPAINVCDYPSNVNCPTP